MSDTLNLTIGQDTLAVNQNSATFEVQLVTQDVLTVEITEMVGVPGGVAPGVQVFNEFPSGSINGVNKTYTLLHDYAILSTRIYLNTARQFLNNDYVEVGNSQITFVNAPQAGDSIIIDYQKS